MAETNAGLGNLTELKGFLLAESMRASTDFDAQLTAIGLGVAGMLAEHCNRKWEYLEDDVVEMSSNRSFLIASRYPLNMAVPLVVERCDGWVNGAPVWVPVSDAVYNVAGEAGIVYLSSYQGNYMSRLKLTSSGGFWFLGLDTTTTLPTGATEVPPNLKLAWLLQCQALWLVRDNLGLAVAGAGSVSFVTLTLPGYELVPEVRELLTNFVRYQIAG